jgi:hypothetical protein
MATIAKRHVRTETEESGVIGPRRRDGRKNSHIQMYQVNMGIATAYGGVENALFIHNIYFLIQNYKAPNDRDFHDGHYWVYNSMEAFCEIFPCWTRKQVLRIVKSCKEHGLIKVGNYNQIKYDKTQWYTVTDLVFDAYESLGKH